MSAVPVAGVRRLDRAGIVASSLCAVHCGLVALLPALPSTMLGFVARGSTELVLILMASLVGVAAVLVGFVRIHRDIRPLLLLAGGVALMVVRGTLPAESALETPCSIAGAAALVAAHFFNARATRRQCCDACEREPLSILGVVARESLDASDGAFSSNTGGGDGGEGSVGAGGASGRLRR
ncbi:MAG: MerC protein [Myxococcales bacterium]|nr:MerC protein [Myxococcales bacterium]